MATTNKAAWLETKQGHPFHVDTAPMPEPTAHEIIIRTHAVAINPVDWGIQTYGMLVDTYPVNLGCDVAGIVHAVGSAVTKFHPGDRVTASCDLLADRPNKGSFQLYCGVPDTWAAILPESVSFTDGCIFPLAIATAAVALFYRENLALPYPRLDAEPTGKVLFVWGGASSVGSCAIQMAKAAGFEVATTCSAHNFDYCRGIGADYVFDYTKETVVETVLKELKGKTLAGAFDTVFPPDTVKACARIVDELDSNKHVMTVLTGENGLVVPEGLPAGVKTGYSELFALVMDYQKEGANGILQPYPTW